MTITQTTTLATEAAAQIQADGLDPNGIHAYAEDLLASIPGASASEIAQAFIEETNPAPIDLKLQAAVDKEMALRRSAGALPDTEDDEYFEILERVTKLAQLELNQAAKTPAAFMKRFTPKAEDTSIFAVRWRGRLTEGDNIETREAEVGSENFEWTISQPGAKPSRYLRLYRCAGCYAPVERIIAADKETGLPSRKGGEDTARFCPDEGRRRNECRDRYDARQADIKASVYQHVTEAMDARENPVDFTKGLTDAVRRIQGAIEAQGVSHKLTVESVNGLAEAVAEVAQAQQNTQAELTETKAELAETNLRVSALEAELAALRTRN